MGSLNSTRRLVHKLASDGELTPNELQQIARATGDGAPAAEQKAAVEQSLAEAKGYGVNITPDLNSRLDALLSMDKGPLRTLATDAFVKVANEEDLIARALDWVNADGEVSASERDSLAKLGRAVPMSTTGLAALRRWSANEVQPTPQTPTGEQLTAEEARPQLRAALGKMAADGKLTENELLKVIRMAQQLTGGLQRRTRNVLRALVEQRGHLVDNTTRQRIELLIGMRDDALRDLVLQHLGSRSVGPEVVQAALKAVEQDGEVFNRERGGLYALNELLALTPEARDLLVARAAGMGISLRRPPDAPSEESTTYAPLADSPRPITRDDATSWRDGGIHDLLWRLDQNRFEVGIYGRDQNAELLLNEQYDAAPGRDRAPDPLFSLQDRSKLQGATYQTFLALLDNFETDASRPESYPEQELQEIDAFMNAVFYTDPRAKTPRPMMQQAYEYLLAPRSEGGLGMEPKRYENMRFDSEVSPGNTNVVDLSSYESFMETTKNIWFGLYTNHYNGKEVRYASGFEHIFLGETSGQVSGYHYWLKFAMDERGEVDPNSEVNYLGDAYGKPQAGERGRANPDVALVTMDWTINGRTHHKRKGGFFVGVSPEWMIASGTVAMFENIAHDNGLPLPFNNRDMRDTTINGQRYHMAVWRNSRPGGGRGMHLRSLWPGV